MPARRRSGRSGATDQHSQVQLFMEGPFDKVVTFMPVDRPDRGRRHPLGRPACRRTWPTSPAARSAVCLQAEYQATSAAPGPDGPDELLARICPSSPRPRSASCSCSSSSRPGYAGVWYGVDPFDQPGVELGKRLTFAAMGRPGYSAEPITLPAGDVA